MYSHANFCPYFYTDQRIFLLYFVTLLIISNNVYSVKSENLTRRDQPGLQEYPSNTTDEADSDSKNKDDQLFVAYTNWLLILPYVPIAILIVACCFCRRCGYKQVKHPRLETVAVEQPLPTYSSATENTDSLSYSTPIWTIPAPPYASVVTNGTPYIYEEDPPAYETLFETKQEGGEAADIVLK